jgi:hypothetical protein
VRAARIGGIGKFEKRIFLCTQCGQDFWSQMPCGVPTLSSWKKEMGMPLYESLGKATSPPLVFQKNNLFLNFVA